MYDGRPYTTVLAVIILGIVIWAIVKTARTEQERQARRDRRREHARTVYGRDWRDWYE